MPITEISKQLPSSAEDTARRLKEWADSHHLQDSRWIRMLGAGGLFAGAMLLAGGKRKAGLTVATVGTALVILEEPKRVAAAWAALPSYIQAGEHFLDRLHGFVEQIAAQKERVRGFVDRVQH
jgi:hypothetical protein